MILQGQFASRNGKHYIVEIDNPNVRGELTLGVSPLVIGYDMESMSAGAMTVSAEVSVIADRDYSGIYADTPMGTKILVRETVTDKVIYTGFMVPSEWDVDNNGVTDQYTIEAVDPVSALKYYRYELECGKAAKDKDAERRVVTMLSILKRAAVKCGLTKIAATVDLESYDVSEDAMLPVDWDGEDGWLMWSEALQMNARNMGACVYVWGDMLRCDGVNVFLNNVQTWVDGQLIGPNVTETNYILSGGTWFKSQTARAPWVYDFDLLTLSRRRDLQRSIVSAKSRVIANIKRAEYSTLMPDPIDKERWVLPASVIGTRTIWGTYEGKIIGEWTLSGTAPGDGEPHKDFKASETQWVSVQTFDEYPQAGADIGNPRDFNRYIKDKFRVLPRARRVTKGAEVWLEVEMFCTTKQYLDDWNESQQLIEGGLGQQPLFACNGQEMRVLYPERIDYSQKGFITVILAGRYVQTFSGAIDIVFNNYLVNEGYHVYIRSIKSWFIEHETQPRQRVEVVLNDTYIDDVSIEQLHPKMTGEPMNAIVTADYASPHRIQKGTIEADGMMPLRAAMFKGVLGLMMAANWDVAMKEARISVFEQKAFVPKPDKDKFEVESIGRVEVRAVPTVVDGYGGRVDVILTLWNVTVRNTTQDVTRSYASITSAALAKELDLYRKETYTSEATCNGEYVGKWGVWASTSLILPNMEGSQFLDDMEIEIKVKGAIGGFAFEATKNIIQHPFVED